ncbi:uncharacterized protein LOC134760304 isoform X3 [Pongo abelii]|uniref:uncharacterized protein LOC134760304 isoform X3 n=1 Tax=Pongo abelii TaxID=9601 RepID=UPI003007BABB
MAFFFPEKSFLRCDFGYCSEVMVPLYEEKNQSKGGANARPAASCLRGHLFFPQRQDLASVFSLHYTQSVKAIRKCSDSPTTCNGGIWTKIKLTVGPKI